MIIKNCPACRIAPSCCTEWNLLHGEWKDCKDITDCLLKKIVEKCRETCKKRCTNDCLGTKKHCGYGQILQLLDIEECE